MVAAKTKSSLKIHYAYHREGPLSFHPCYLTSITAIIGVIKRIWLHKSGFRWLPVSRELGNGGNTVERILPLGRLAGVRADARRVCSRWIMALQKSTEVEHGRLSPRGKEYGSPPRICFPRRKVSPSLIFLIVGELNRYARPSCRFTVDVSILNSLETILLHFSFSNEKNILRIFQQTNS